MFPTNNTSFDDSWDFFLNSTNEEFIENLQKPDPYLKELFPALPNLVHTNSTEQGSLPILKERITLDLTHSLNEIIIDKNEEVVAPNQKKRKEKNKINPELNKKNIKLQKKIIQL